MLEIIFDQLVQFLPLAVGVGFGFDFGTQKSGSQFGLSQNVRDIAGMSGINAQNRGLNEAEKLLASPIFGINVPLQENRLLGPNQLLGNTTQFVNDLGRNLFSQLSGLGASRGQLSPENLPAVTSGTLTELARNLIPLQQAAIQFATTTPEQQIMNRIGAFLNLGAGFAPFIQGGTSQGSAQNIGGRFEY